MKLLGASPFDDVGSPRRGLAMQFRILQIGRDDLLLQTRAAILRHAGFAIESCLVTSRPDSAHFCLERYFDYPKTEGNGTASPFQAVILCHTLDQERATTIAAEARREEPGIKIVVLEALDGPRVPANLYDLSVSCKYGPATMLEVVKSLFDNGPQRQDRPVRTSRFPKDRADEPGPQLVRARQQQSRK